MRVGQLSQLGCYSIMYNPQMCCCKSTVSSYLSLAPSQATAGGRNLNMALMFLSENWSSVAVL